MKWKTVKELAEHYGFIAEKHGRTYEITWNAPSGEQSYICHTLQQALVAIGALLTEKDLDKQRPGSKIEL